MSGLAQWLLEFRQLHEKARRGQLSGRELQLYRSGRDELARALLAAQRLTLRPGETPRRALRVARALQVDLDFATSRERAVTIDLSTGGFSCLLAKAPPVGDEAGFSLRLPASDALAGRARSSPRSGSRSGRARRRGARCASPGRSRWTSSSPPRASAP